MINLYKNIQNHPYILTKPCILLKSCSIFHLFILLTVLLGITLRFYNIFYYNPIYEIWSDPARHWEQGIDVLRNDPMTLTDPILYQIYIAMLGKLTLGIPELIAFYTFLLSVINIYIWFKVVCILQNNNKISLLALAVFSLVPDWISIYSYFMQETLFLPLFGLSLYCTLRSTMVKDTKRFAFMIISWSLTGLTRGIAIPLAIFSSLYVFVLQKNRIKNFLVGLTILLLILGPLTVRSYDSMKLFSPHGIGYLSMIYTKSAAKKIVLFFNKDGAKWNYFFQSPAIENEPFKPLYSWKSKRTGTVYVNIDITQGKIDWERELNKYHIFPDKIWLIKENILLLMFSESWPNSNHKRLIGYLNYQTRWLWSILYIITINAFIFNKSLRKDPYIFYLTLVWFIIQGLIPISVNEGRYRIPYTGLVLCLMFYYLSTLIENKKNINVRKEPNSIQ